MTAIAHAGPRFATVPFLGTDILAARDGDIVRVPMRRFCASIGVDWPPQLRRINRDAELAKGVTMMVIPSEGGEQEQVSLPLGLIPGFLFGLEPRRFAPELRDRISAFRAECYAVLYAHFHRPAATVAPVAMPSAPVFDPRDDAARRAIPQLIAAIKVERSPVVRRTLHHMLGVECERIGLDTPALPELGGFDPASERVEQLLLALSVLTSRGVAWNHQPFNRRAVINLPQLARLFASHDVDIAIDDDLRAALSGSTDAHRIWSTVVDSRITGRATYVTIIEPLS